MKFVKSWKYLRTGKIQKVKRNILKIDDYIWTKSLKTQIYVQNFTVYKFQTCLYICINKRNGKTKEKVNT